MSTQNIGARLAQEPIDEIQQAIYRPLLESVNPNDFQDMLAVNQAHLVMLNETGLLDNATAVKLAAAMQQLGQDGACSTEPIDTRVEDPYFAFELRLGKIAGTHTAGFLHLARSRNDIGATLDRLRASRLALEIMKETLDLRSVCLERADAYKHVVMPGYTHLQPAQPITYGYLLAAYAEAFARDYQRLAESFSRINKGAMGAAALAGSSFPIDRERVADLLGFDTVTENGLDTVGSRDFALELLYAVTQMAVTWNRIIQDFHVFVTNEFNAIEFPDSIAGISSIMPQKKNPVALEFLRAESARSVGALMGALTAVRSTNFTVTLDAIREGLTDLWSTLDRMPLNIRLLKQVILHAQPNADQLLERCRYNFTTVTDLADGLVVREGLSFREAHHVVGLAVRLALDEGIRADGLNAALINKAAREITGRDLDIDDLFVQECLDPMAGVTKRNCHGGVSPDAVQYQVRNASALLEEDSAQQKHWVHAKERAKEKLNVAVDALVNQRLVTP